MNVCVYVLVVLDFTLGGHIDLEAEVSRMFDQLKGRTTYT
jgi:hypothetical protein